MIPEHGMGDGLGHGHVSLDFFLFLLYCTDQRPEDIQSILVSF